MDRWFSSPLRLVAVTGALLLACGGGASTTPPPDRLGGGGDADEELAPLDKAGMCERAQTQVSAANQEAWDRVVAAGPPETLEDMAAAACQIYCGRATECAIDEACTTMSDGEIAELKLEQTAPENTRRCVETCNTWKLTKQQIQVLGSCSQTESDCATFRSCTDEAQAR